MRAAMRIDDWDKFQELGRIWNITADTFYSHFASFTITRSETWHFRFFECDWARATEIALRHWFRVALMECGSRVFSVIIQRMLENPRNDRDYVWGEDIQYLIRRRTLAGWLSLSPDTVRRNYSDEIIRDKQRGIVDFVLPYQALVETVTTLFRLSLQRDLDVICAAHAEVERRLFPEPDVLQ
jgi:hypothetical protein